MNIPTNARPSTRILKDLLKVRKELIKVENSNQPFVSKIDPINEKRLFFIRCFGSIPLLWDEYWNQFKVGRRRWW